MIFIETRFQVVRDWEYVTVMSCRFDKLAKNSFNGIQNTTCCVCTSITCILLSINR